MKMKNIIKITLTKVFFKSRELDFFPISVCSIEQSLYRTEFLVACVLDIFTIILTTRIALVQL